MNFVTKNMISVCIISSLATLALADGPAPSPSVSPAPSLKAGMKQVGAVFKVIFKAAKDPSKNAESAENAKQLVIHFQSVINIVPEEIAKMPTPQQPAAIADYKRLIQIEIENATALEKAFRSNDNVSALSILDQMTVTKKEGHSKYNP